MSLSAGHLDALLAAGATAEQIVALVKADMAERELAAAAKREKDANRQRRHRASRDVTVTACDIQDKGSLEVSPHTPLPNPSKQSPLSPPNLEEEKLAAVGTCLKRAFPAKLELPDWIDPETWAEFRAMRKKMRNVPFELAAERRSLAKLERLRDEGHDPEKLISKAVENGHRTFYPDESTKADIKRAPSPAEQLASLKRMLPIYRENGRDDLAEQCQRRIADMEREDPPDRRVTSIVRDVTKGLAA